jgi:hypothetical protein
MTLQTTQPTPNALEALQGETVFMAEIGPLAGLSHNCGWAWQQSFADFPKSIGTKRGANNKLNPTYSKLAALAWLIRHGKIDPIEGIDPDAILPPFVASKGKRKKNTQRDRDHSGAASDRNTQPQAQTRRDRRADAQSQNARGLADGKRIMKCEYCLLDKKSTKFRQSNDGYDMHYLCDECTPKNLIGYQATSDRNTQPQTQDSKDLRTDPQSQNAWRLADGK